jgi:glycosyltransferase involved in cell wall biosynthesis
VIPAKDEAPTVFAVVASCLPFAREVIVVDGHSRDATVLRASAAGARVLYDHGRGKGDAIRTAIPEIETPISVFLDADGSHDPNDVPRLTDPIRSGHADHVAASRLIGGSSELHGGFDEFFRLAGSAFITACINRRFGVRLSDTQNGFRAIRTDVLRQLGLRANGTTIEQEMVIKTLAAGYRLVEVPSHESARRFGESHIHLWRVIPSYVCSLIRHLIACRVTGIGRRASTDAAQPLAEPVVKGRHP